MQEQTKLGIIQGDPELVSSTKTWTKKFTSMFEFTLL